MKTQTILIYLFTFILTTTAFAGDIQITSPTSDSKTYSQSVISITWNPGNTAKFVKIEYTYSSFGGKMYNLLSSKSPNNGQFDWDLGEHNTSVISIKITDTSNPRNYSIVNNISLEECNIEAAFEMPQTICTNQLNIIKNTSINATSFEWILDEKVISTKQDLELQLSSFQEFKLTLKAYNSNCSDSYYIHSYEQPNLDGNSGPCTNPVIEEMVIVDNNEIFKTFFEIPVSIDNNSKILAFQVTHTLKEGIDPLGWNWDKQAIPGFSPGCIDYSKASEGIVSVNWTSEKVSGTAYSGTLYSISAESFGAMAREEEVVQPVVKRKRGLKLDYQKPSSLGSLKLLYKNTNDTSNSDNLGFIKTTGVILTTDGIIVLE